MSVSARHRASALRSSFWSSLLPIVPLLVLSPLAMGQADSDSSGSASPLNSLLPLPIFFYTPETGLAAGGSLLYFFRDPENGSQGRPSNILSDVIITQKKQIIADLAYELYFRHEQYRSNGSIQFIKFPDKFFGIGNTTPDNAEEKFTAQSFRVRVNALTALSKEFNAGPLYFFEDRRMLEVEPAGSLSNGSILGSRDGVTSAAGLMASWDTRDNIFSAYRGRFHQVSLMLSEQALGSDYSFSLFELDLREYLSVADDDVLGFQAFGTFIGGSAPFHRLARLGGQMLMRGYYDGRFRDNNALAAQAEYRSMILSRIGVVGFFGLGEVSHDIDGFSLNGIKTSYGIGVRYMFSREERLNLRLDVGFGQGVSAFYIGAGEVF